MVGLKGIDMLQFDLLHRFTGTDLWVSDASSSLLTCLLPTISW